jgi:hypothetical protein
VERIGLAVVLPHPERNSLPNANLKSDPVTEKRAVAAVIAYEQTRACKIEDVQSQDLGFDLRSLHPVTGELRLIEVKGVGAATGTIFLSPNENAWPKTGATCTGFTSSRTATPSHASNNPLTRIFHKAPDFSPPA